MLSSIVIFATLFGLIWLTCIFILGRVRRRNSIAIFHLNCSSGGGGERVLWYAIEALFKKYPDHTIYIYSHKHIKNDTLETLVKVKELFQIDLISNRHIIDKLEFVPLSLSPLVEAKWYPCLTLFFQNFMSMLVAAQAAYQIVPEIYMETIGFTFTLPVFKLLRCHVITYVHYPTISSDMIQDVLTSSHSSFNNREIFVKSSAMRSLKLVYYRLLASLYGSAGRQSDLVMTNSLWTQKHIDSLWKTKTHVVHPPCDVESFKSLSVDRFKSADRNLNIVSIAQFRPEKNHQMQIEAFDAFLAKSGARDSKLTMYGGCRDESDHQRVAQLRDLIDRLDLSANIEIFVGVSFEGLLNGLRKADVAIHTMKNEHFGIVLLECMAAGLIVVAHDSGGPREDIIESQVSGFLADTAEDFTERLLTISRMGHEARQALRKGAVERSDLFTTKIFKEKFIELVGETVEK